MNILLIAPVAPGYVPLYTNYVFPIGLASISAVLKQAGHHVRCLNMHHLDRDIEAELEAIGKEGGLELIGVGGLSFMYHEIKAVLTAVNKVFPGVKTVLGGNIVTCAPETVVADLGVDFGVIGEGENTIVELVAALESGGDARGIPGMAVRLPRSGEIIRTPIRNTSVNLDSLPIPDYDGFQFGKHLDTFAPTASVQDYPDIDNPRPLAMLGSRSCPFQCTFCYHPPGERYRKRSLTACFAEIDYAVARFGINYVDWGDEVLFTKNDTEALREICAGLKQRGLPWCCQTLVSAVTPEALGLMKESGCRLISYGIENISDVILRSMKKPATREQIEYALEITYNHGIDIQGNILFGDVAETLETAAENIRWWLRNRKYMLALIPILVLPNSRLYLTAREKGIIGDDLEYMQGDMLRGLVNVTGMSDAEYDKMLRMIIDVFDAPRYYPGFLEDYGSAGVDACGRERYSIQARCPHCGGSSRHGSLVIPHPADTGADWLTLKCRVCTRRFHVTNIRLWLAEPGLPRRLFTTHYPPMKLAGLYLGRGGSVGELARAAATQGWAKKKEDAP